MRARKELGRRLSLIITFIQIWNGLRKQDVETELQGILGVSVDTLRRYYRGDLPRGDRTQKLEPQFIIKLLNFAHKELPSDIAYGLFRHIFQAYARYAQLDAFPDEETLLHRYFPEMHQSHRFPLPMPDSSVQFATEGEHVERDYDRYLISYLLSGVGIVTLKGSYQSGKTALMAYVKSAMVARDYQSVYLDFRQLHFAIDDSALFYQEFCSMISEELGLSDKTDAFWAQGLTPNRTTTKYMSKQILSAVNQPLILFMDTADILADSSFRDDFFAMVRSWFDRRKMSDSWKQLNIVLGISTEPYLLIKDPLQSPFNVGEPINMEQDFIHAETELLNELRNNCFTANELNELMFLVNGHPYLTNRGLTVVANDMYTAQELLAKALDEDGPFGEHLKYMKRKLENAGLKEALLAAWKGKKIDVETQHRLKRSGYARIAKDGSLVPRCRLYHDYLTA